jgi:transposase
MKVTSLLGWKDAVKCQAITLGPDHIQLHLATKSAVAFCPFCGSSANRIHSRYSRKLVDLPWAGKTVEINLQVRRFFCDNKQCYHKTFAERLIMAPAYARKVLRLQTHLLLLAVHLGGRAAARLSRLLGMPVSHYTLLRNLMKLPDPPVASPKVLGVDDWAMKKGLDYATILVDFERHQAIELLADRESIGSVAGIASWRRDHYPRSSQLLC